MSEKRFNYKWSFNEKALHYCFEENRKAKLWFKSLSLRRKNICRNMIKTNLKKILHGSTS